jgi:hypothetical protein
MLNNTSAAMHTRIEIRLICPSLKNQTDLNAESSTSAKVCEDTYAWEFNLK